MWIDVAGNNADGMDDVAMEAAMRVLVVSCYGNLLMCDLEGRRCVRSTAKVGRLILSYTSTLQSGVFEV